MLKSVRITMTAGLVSLAAVATSYPSCEEGITCFTITPSDKPELTFDCGYVPSVTDSLYHGTTKGFVYHMHGNDGLQSKAMFFETMRQLGALGFASLSCDARGYSPKAAPYDYDSYHYDVLQSDIFSIVDASGYSAAFGGKFHVVAHDQGARVAWHAIAMGSGRDRFLSFSPLSIPHADVFSNALVSTEAVPGVGADPEQQQASQYVRQLTLPNSTTFDTGEVWTVDCPGFATPEDCQKTLWWYNGAIDSGAMALAPSMPYDKGTVADQIGIPIEMVEDNTQYPLEGVAQSVFVGKITEFPVFFGCGALDTCDLCKETFSAENAELIDTYTFLKKNECGHNVLGCAYSQEYIDGIIANIQSIY